MDKLSKMEHPDKNQQIANQIDHKEGTIRLYDANSVWARLRFNQMCSRIYDLRKITTMIAL